MDFVQVIKDQNSKINESNPYLEILWAHLNEKSNYDLGTPTIERRTFLNHLPLNLSLFLNDCIHKIQDVINAGDAIDWSTVNLKYLKSFLYWCLLQGDEQGNLVPLTTAKLYFMLNTLPQSQKKLYVESIHFAALNVIESFVGSDNIPDLLQDVIDKLRVFLQNNTLTKDAIATTVTVLNKIVNIESRITFNRFSSDQPSTNLNHAAFICLHVLLGKLQEKYEQNKEQILCTLFSLMSCMSSLQTRRKTRESAAALQYNLKHLLKSLYKQETIAKCPVLIVIKTLAVHPDFDQYDQMVAILCDLHYEVYADYSWWVAEGLICDKKELRMQLPDMAVPLAVHTHGNQTQEKKDALVEVLILNLIKLCGDSNLDIAQSGLRNLERVVYLNDSSVKDTVKNLLTKDHEAVLHIITTHIDKQWKRKNTNHHFINVICKLYAFKRNILKPKLMHEIDGLLSQACPMDLRPCMNHLAELLKNGSGQPHVADVILKFFVRMSLCPVGLSNFYAKVFYDVLFRSVEQSLDSSACLNVADLFISQHYDHKEVFKKFNSINNLLTPHKLHVLINFKVNENPKALKLICSLLDHIDYKHFEGLATFTRRTFQQKTYAHADLLFYALDKILGKLSRPVHAQDAQFSEELLHFLENEVRTRNLPVSCSSNAVGLLLKLERRTGRNLQLHHIFTELETSLYNKLLKMDALEAIEPFEVCRDLSYLGDFLLLTDETLGERVISLLRNVLRIDDERLAYLSHHPDVWGLLVAFFARLSLKKEEFVEEITVILENALMSENENVRYHALLSLEDICSYRLNYFQPLVPHVFKFIQEDGTNFLIITCVRIINRLINEDYILLDEQQYVALTALLAHKNDCIRARVEKILRESFLLKCQRAIAKFFVPSIIYYNKYKHHCSIYVADDAVSFTLSAAQRRRIYEFLLNSMQTTAQFHVVNEMSSELLAKISAGTLIHCADLLADCAAVTGIFLAHLGDDCSRLNNSGQEKLLKEIKDVVEKKRGVAVTKYHDHGAVIKRLLLRLLSVTFQVHLVDASLRPELIQIVMQTTKVFFPEITKLIMDGSEDLRKLYSKFIIYHEKHRHTLCGDEDTEMAEDYVDPGPSTSRFP